MRRDGAGRPSVAGKSIYFLLVDRFARHVNDSTPCSGDDWCGGTLLGVMSHLDYIQGMGFECVWISPVTQQPAERFGLSGTGYHGYWTQDWYGIDRHFGTGDELRALSQALKARGMCLVLDVVVNHVRPVHSTADLTSITPFDRPEHYHTLRADRGNNQQDPASADVVARFDEYARHPLSAFSSFGADA